MTIATKELYKSELWWVAEGAGAHGPDAFPPETVQRALEGSFSFVAEGPTRQGLRSPQLGALHAILAHRSMEDPEAITIVMPTGTGKTETMLAAFVESPARTLVIVPSDALRTQIASKFVTLGILPEVGAITGDFLCPTVLVLSSGLATPSEVDNVVRRANVVVATPQALNACSEGALARIGELCDRLFVDEAHHTAARTWRSVADLFAQKETVQFTATPYREDGQHLGGRIAYAYPLRLAQRNGYFARINYRSVIELAEPDRAVAAASIEQLRSDLDGGLDHLLMARVSSVARAREVIRHYQEMAPDLAPVRIDTGLVESSQKRNLQALLARESKIVVCVSMLGEGFDLPALKVAAIHDPQKSLAVTLQFIGRFTRVGGDDLGEASAFVPLQVAGIDHRLRKLYGEDADWNEVIEDLTQHQVGQEKKRTDFEREFGSLPHEVAMRSIHPKMSTVTYRGSQLEWDPESIYELFEGRLLTTRLGINNRDKVVWWVSEEATPVRWGDFSSFVELEHHLYVVHVDDAGGFLYVNSSNNSSLHEKVAEAVGGSGVRLVSGETIYRVLAGIDRRIPKNVGLLDAVSRTRRFSMHVGQDVLAAWRGEGGTKLKTNIFAHGYKDGRSVSFGASRKGRVWSHQEAKDIHDWVQWAREVGPVVTDESISLESVMSGFLLPEPAVERPKLVPLTIEWPYELIATIGDRRRLAYQGEDYALVDCELRLTNHEADGPLGFEVITPTWSLEYTLVFSGDEPPTVQPVGEDGFVQTPKGSTSLASFLTHHGLLVSFENEVVLVEQGFLMRPNREARLFPKSRIEVFDWTDINIKKESQGVERDPETVQFRTIEVLSSESDWEIILDDDGTGELADVVLLRRDDAELHALLVHCKYSSEPRPGARIRDLYDVCGQAMKMNRAKSMPDLLLRRLLRRETKRQSQGGSGLILGDTHTLTSIVRESQVRNLKSEVMIVQPGMSKSKASDDMRALIGGVERFLLDTYGMPLRVVGSE